MRRSLLLAAFGVLCCSAAFAGVTIHYRGSVADDGAVDKVSEAACAEAKKNSWTCRQIAGDEIADIDVITARSIARLENSPDFSKARGVVVQIDPMSEPLYLVFGSSRRIDNFVKTQFAGADAHIRTVEFLQKMKPYFTDFSVEDEGGYWESKDRAKLEQELKAIDVLMARIRSQNPKTDGPVKRPDGRILDLVAK